MEVKEGQNGLFEKMDCQEIQSGRSSDRKLDGHFNTFEASILARRNVQFLPRRPPTLDFLAVYIFEQFIVSS